MLILELVLCAVGIASAVVVSVGFGDLPAEEHTAEFIGSFGVLMLIVAIYLRVWWGRFTRGEDDRTRLLWYLPAVMTVIIAPGLLADQGSSGPRWIVDVLLFAAVAYGAAILGALALLFVMVPLELLGRGILRLVIGRPDGGWLLFWGAFLALVTTFAFVGAFALDGIPAGRAGLVPLLCALLGIPFGYMVESELLLWIARGLVVVLTAMLLASAHFGEVSRVKRAAETAAERQDSRDRRRSRREAQLERDRAAREER